MKKENKIFSVAPGEEDIQDKKEIEEKKDVFPGYPLYPISDDIYNKDKEEQDLNPENIDIIKAANEKHRKRNEKDFNEDITGEDLDVPGSEAEEADENSGSEDEENNYYSLGGDNHNDLEEDRGE